MSGETTPGDASATDGNDYLLGHDDAAIRNQRRRSVDKNARFVIPVLTSTSRVLDVGCGPGALTASFAKYAPRGYIVGVDRGAELIARATADHPAVHFRVADVTTRLPFPSDSFDVVFAHYVLKFVTPISEAVREMRRVCRPGGYVALCEIWTAATIAAPAHAGFDVFHRVFPAAVAAGGGDATIAQRLPRLLRDAGFDDVRVSASSLCYSEKEERALFADECISAFARGKMAKQVRELGIASEQDMRLLEDALLQVRDAEDAAWILHCVEFLARK